MRQGGGGLQTAVSSGGDLAFMPPQPVLVPGLREQRDSAVQAVVTLDGPLRLTRAGTRPPRLA